MILPKITRVVVVVLVVNLVAALVPRLLAFAAVF
jgi:hypothetical protein